MSYSIKAGVSWVGKIDWELRKFHGEELSTHRGSSYNAYLVRDEKTVLIDTVWTPYAHQFVTQLRKEIDLAEIDYVIVNHSERDHSGALSMLMRYIPATPIYCTANCQKFLKAQYHQDWNFVTVKTGDKLSLGKKEIVFIEAMMLHWPDSMFSYLTGDNILFSNDAFGQHLASEMLYSDLVDKAELYQEALKYYANILTPFSRQVEKKIQEVLALGVPVDMICPSHGLVWRNNPLQIVDAYQRWAGDYQENQITVLYDTMWNSTRLMAEAIALGIRQSDPEVTVKLLNVGQADKNDAIAEVFKSKAVLVGSPTVNQGLCTAIAGIVEEIKGLRFKNKKAAAFGSYGWGGEAVKLLSARMAEAGFTMVNEGLREQWVPDGEALQRCIKFGQEFAQSAR